MGNKSLWEYPNINMNNFKHKGITATIDLCGYYMHSLDQKYKVIYCIFLEKAIIKFKGKLG